VPKVLQAWLWAAEAEALAAAGEERLAREALDQAARCAESCGDDSLPYVFLDGAHLARWRGHTLARLGAAEAVDDLSSALGDLDPSFTRARAGLLGDLALAFAARGDHAAAGEHAQLAYGLAESTTSARQLRRLRKILSVS
jgi:hypothetical protein